MGSCASIDSTGAQGGGISNSGLASAHAEDADDAEDVPGAASGADDDLHASADLHHRPLPPADVLEVIAEYACTTVRDVCALRATSRGFRRALDTTVRRCTCATQPTLCCADSGSDGAASRGVLRLHRDGSELDAVRIALTCDRFPSIARLVVVAFALDGAKDELREGGVCGPRPVDWCDASVTAEHEVTERTVATSRWGEAAMLSSGAARDALVRCVVAARISSKLLTPELCAAAEAGTAFFSLRRLAFRDVDDDGPTCARLVAAVGPRLTHLFLRSVTLDICPAIASCASLRRFEVRRAVPHPGTAAALVDALIASGAPLRRVVLDFLRDDDTTSWLYLGLWESLTDEQLTRLLTAVPSIVEVAGASVKPAELPADIANRMEIVDIHAPSGLRVVAREADWTPSAYVTDLLCLDREGPSPDWDLAATFPNLAALRLRVRNPNFGLDNVRLSAALTTVSCSFDVAFRLGLLNQLADHGVPRLPRLHTVHIFSCNDTAATRSAAVLDVTPLIAFASTLQHLDIGEWGAEDATNQDGFIRLTLEWLVNLETARVPGLPNSVCFLGGKHTRLRELRVRRVHDPDAGADFARLAARCPRLVLAEGTEALDVAFTPPAGWARSHGSTLSRLSFGEEGLSLFDGI